MPAQPKLFTITGNLLAETSLAVEYPRRGKTVRARGAATFQVGGKGVNVAKAYRLITAQKARAIIFPAGDEGARCLNALKRANFCAPLPVPISGETRIGLVCRDPKTGLETTFLGADIEVPQKAFDEALETLRKNASAGDFVALCGSFPGWKSGYAKKLASLCAKLRLNLCADTYGAPLRGLAKQPLFLLKINRAEFCQTFGQKTLSKKSLEAAAPQIGAKYLAVTNASGKICARGGGKTFLLAPPKIPREVSATGCGDVMAASLIAELSAGGDFLGALKISAARASASAETAKTAQWSEPRAKQLLRQIF